MASQNQLLFCRLCGDSIFLIKDFSIKQCPKRPEDGSILVDEDTKQIQSTLRVGEIVVIKRNQLKFERQERLNCSRCGVTVAYSQGGRYLYIFANSYDEKSDLYPDCSMSAIDLAKAWT